MILNILGIIALKLFVDVEFWGICLSIFLIILRFKLILELNAGFKLILLLNNGFKLILGLNKGFKLILGLIKGF